MLKSKILLLFVAFNIYGCGACDSDAILSNVCPKPEPCIIATINGETKVYTGNVKTIGECRRGFAVYDEECNVSCPDYIGPSKEICDGLDNDCDGFFDEGFDLDFDGVTSCAGDCDDHNPNVFPGREEDCDLVDNDCDGEIDGESLLKECWTGPSGAVFSDTSICKRGVSKCVDGIWQYCNHQALPRPFEICDGMDNDCDGEVDEPEYDFCGPLTTEGACRKGAQICSGTETYCVDEVYPSDEICNNVDDDCNGLVDDGLSRVCQTACGMGEEVCKDGQWVGCNAPVPVVEICDGLDNDCNGVADEGCECDQGDVVTCKQDIINMTTGQPVNCGFGVSVCDAFGEFGPCYFFGTEPETCNNWDDDCDGQIDGMSSPCGNLALDHVGECRAGTSSCSFGHWNPCAGAVPPVQEFCDGLDNDCDGQIDEDLDPHNKVDVFFLLDGSGSMCTKVDALGRGIARYASDFIGTEHRFGLGVYPGYSSTVIVVIPLTDIETFISMLYLYECSYPGVEPGYDAALLVTASWDPLGIGWQTASGTVTAAYPYAIFVSDERANQGIATELDVAVNTINCSVGACMPGDHWEFFAIVPSTFFYEWDSPTFGDPDRLIDLYPVGEDRYVKVLRNIFSNVCRQ